MPFASSEWGSFLVPLTEAVDVDDFQFAVARFEKLGFSARDHDNCLKKQPLKAK